MHPRAPGLQTRPATIRLRVYCNVHPGPRSRETQVGVGSFSFAHSLFLSFLFSPDVVLSRGDISSRSPRVHFALLPSTSPCEISARERIQNANAPDPWHSITSRTRTLTAIGDLSFRDPYYLNAGALFAGWYRGDRNIPRHNEQQAPYNESEDPGERDSVRLHPESGFFSKLVLLPSLISRDSRTPILPAKFR